MEVTLTPIQKRSLLRRTAPWALSLGLFAGGGWGLFQYVAQDGEAAEVAAADKPATARDRLRDLFESADESARETDQRYEASETVDAGSRYVGQPTGDATDGAVLASSTSAPPSNPFATADSSYTNRYASAAAPVVEPHAAPVELTVADEPEVARGQDAYEGNPLRSPVAAPTPATTENERDVRTAFEDAAPAAAPAATGGAGRYASNPYQNDFANAFASSMQESPTPEVAEPQPAEPEIAEPAPAAAVQQFAEPPARPLAQQQPVIEYGATPRSSAPASIPPTPADTSAPYGSAPYGSAAYDSEPQQVDNPYVASAAEPSNYDGMPADDPGYTPTPGIVSAVGTGRPGERGLEGAQSPSLAIQKLSPEEIQVGKKATFAVRVKNVGQRAAHGVTIHDEIPLGTKLVGTAPRADVAGADVSWDLGTLSVGEERVVEMELIPTDEGELGSVATVSFTAQASARARCTRPQLALRLTAQPRVMIGDKHLVQVEVSNPGTGNATGVMLLENIPQGVTHEAGPSLEYEIGTLQAGESRMLELVLTAAQAGMVQNVMVARADANLEVQAACEFEVLAPDLHLTVDGPQMRYLERPAKYTVSVDNPGTAAAHDVQLVTHLPKGLQFVSANNLGEYDPSTHAVYWSLAELPANERGAVEVVALPIEAGDHTLKVATKAQQGLEDQAEAHVRVEGLAALTVEVSDLEDLIEVGGETTYEIRVLNQGSKAATNVQIAALFTPGLRVIAAEGETRHAVQNDRVTFAPLPQLPPRGETVFRVNVQAVNPGDQRLRVQVGSDDLQQPITEEESTRVYADQ
ncbi:MAG: DUF11 domain-containing protein [Planctomycetales bacterium]|nr:DUF11 domain-containing protein [Planctomycetales bacterium]